MWFIDNVTDGNDLMETFYLDQQNLERKINIQPETEHDVSLDDFF